MSRRSALVLVGPALLVGACSVEETMPAPSCHESGSIVIVAQSVPTATLVPCVDALPEGWAATRVGVHDGGAHIRFEHVEGHGTARLDFGLTCPGDGTGVEAGRAGAMERIVDIVADDGSRHRRFEGGCVSWHFGDATSEEIGDRLVRSVDLVERDALEDELRRTFVDEDL